MTRRLIVCTTSAMAASVGSYKPLAYARAATV